LEEVFGKDICVYIQTPLAYLSISAPTNQGFRYANCGRTGVGVSELIEKTEEVNMLGRTYTASGFEFKGVDDNADMHDETLVLTLDDGTRIEYGSRPVDEAGFVDYEMKGRPIIFQILETFEMGG
jgi:hypothetical protein